MVSIIVPIYNREKTLSACIDSILAQTYSDYELILIDDGSEDLSGEICEQYAAKDNRIRVIHCRNCGPGAARNKGLNVANGDYILFCDSDDTVEKYWVERLLEPFTDERIILTVCNYKKVYHRDISKNAIDVNAFTFSVKDALQYFNVCCLNTVWHCCFKNTELRFSETLNYGEDAIYSLAYLLDYMKSSSNIIYYSDDCLYNYLVDSDESLTRKNSATIEYLEAKLAIISEMKEKYYLSDKYISPMELCFSNQLYRVRLENSIKTANQKEYKKLLSQSENWQALLESLKGSYLYILYRSKSMMLLNIYYNILKPITSSLRRGIGELAYRTTKF